MRVALATAAAAMLCALTAVQCGGAIGDMWGHDAVANVELVDLPLIYCDYGTRMYPLDPDPLLMADASLNVVRNYPMLFHSMMCQLQYFCEPDYNPVSPLRTREPTYMRYREFPGCADPETRAHAATSRLLSMSDRDGAISQLVPFFEAGGPTNIGIITIGPLMHAYGGSPFCVWPAESVVNVTMGAPYSTVFKSDKPLRAGVGRGGCFDVRGWLACTNWADRPHGFHTAAHPMADLGNFLQETLGPSFNIDWGEKGIPVPGLFPYPESFYLTNSPNYLSSEPVPISASNAALRTEPWIRSWEALGGLSCVAWHTNTNVFEYAAEDIWSMGTMSTAFSNQFVSAMRQYMENGHPAIGNRDYFPTNGLGVVRTQYSGPQGWNGAAVRPNDGHLGYEPSYIFARGPQPSVEMPVPQNIGFNWTVTNMNARTLTAPVSNRTVEASVSLLAKSVKKWKYRKIELANGDIIPITNGTEVADFGWGEREYGFTMNLVGPTAYYWELEDEGSPVTHVDFSAVSNFMQTAVHANLVTNGAWRGLSGAWNEEAGPMGVSTTCTYWEGTWGVNSYFVSGEGGKYGNGMDNFLYFLVTGDEYFGGADKLSMYAHPMAREPELFPVGYESSYNYGYWTGEGHDYTIKTQGPPPPFNSGSFTNIAYFAQYSTMNEAGVVEDWRDSIYCDVNGNVTYKVHQKLPAESWGAVEEYYGGYTPSKVAWAISDIEFTIEQECDLMYKVEWAPVRAWGVLNNVTGHQDWPDPNEPHY